MLGELKSFKECKKKEKILKNVRTFTGLELKYLKGIREATGLFIVERNDSRYQG